MSAFSFESLHGAIAEPMEMDETISLNQLVNHSWTDNDYREPLTGYSYASSSSSFSCGSLTSGCLTPQSSLSASPPRRQSLASAGKSTSTFSPPGIPPSHFATPRTPKKYADASPSQTFSPQGSYIYSMSAGQSLEDTFAVDPVGINLSGKLQSALGIKGFENTDTDSFPAYEQGQNLPGHGIFRVEDELQLPVPAKSEYQEYTLDHGTYRHYQHSFGSSCPHEAQQVSLPQTIAPSQTTYKREDTPPPALGEPFESPIKAILESSSVAQSPSFDSQQRDVGYTRDAPASPTTRIPTGLHQLHWASDIESEDDDVASTFRKRIQLKKSRVAPRSRGLHARDTPRSIYFKAEYIKTEPGSQHRCPRCPDERRFKRIEHLTRHVNSAHAAGEMERCIIKGCNTEIMGRPDNMREHYKRTHMYGLEERKGKKNTFVSIKEARELGLSHIDPRVNPPAGKARKRVSCT